MCGSFGTEQHNLAQQPRNVGGGLCWWEVDDIADRAGVGHQVSEAPTAKQPPVLARTGMIPPTLPEPLTSRHITRIHSPIPSPPKHQGFFYLCCAALCCFASRHGYKARLHQGGSPSSSAGSRLHHNILYRALPTTPPSHLPSIQLSASSVKSLALQRTSVVFVCLERTWCLTLGHNKNLEYLPSHI